MRKLLVTLVLLSGVVFGQATTVAPFTGSMFIDVGASVNHYALPPSYGGLVDFGIQFGQSNFFNVSTLELQSTVANVRTGVAYQLKASGNIRVIAIMDGGLTAASTTGLLPQSINLGNVGGGVLVRYDIGHFFKSKPPIGVKVGFREAAVAGTSVQPEFMFSVNYFLK